MPNYSTLLASAQAGNPDAMFSTALCLFAGIGTRQDLSDARMWAQRAKDAGNEQADFLLDSINAGNAQLLTAAAPGYPIPPGDHASLTPMIAALAASAMVLVTAGLDIPVKLHTASINRKTYHTAEELYEKGDYYEAYTKFLSLYGYKDSGERAEEAQQAMAAATASSNQNTYQSALSLMQDGDYAAAAEQFGSIRSYEDSDTYYTECTLRASEDTVAQLISSGDIDGAREIYFNLFDDKNTDESRLALSSKLLAQTELLQAGDFLYFGSFEQEHTTETEPTALGWLVLDVTDDGDVLLLSQKKLAWGAFSSEKNINYLESDVRSWLTDTFVPSAFSDSERSRLRTPAEVGGSAGADLTDYAFLLNYQEAYVLLGEQGISCSASSTKYSSNSTAKGWWLREQDLLEIIYGMEYNVNYLSDEMKRTSKSCTAAAYYRPAIWVNYTK